MYSGGKAWAARQGAAHADRQLGAEAADDPQDLALAGQVQAVAGFDFHRGHAVAHQASQAFGGAGEQFVFTSGAGGAHGAGDAATGGGDLGIADALQTLLELTATVAAKYRVGVTVDQPRGDPGALEVVDRRVITRRQFGTRADPLDVLAQGNDGGVFDDRVDALGHGGGVAVLPEGFHPGFLVAFIIESRASSLPQGSGCTPNKCGSELARDEAPTGSATTAP
nr:hypothetical protein GCM10020185_26980 [Pseudomonas brassicacearum subsp. brassicacearum]